MSSNIGEFFDEDNVIAFFIGTGIGLLFMCCICKCCCK